MTSAEIPVDGEGCDFLVIGAGIAGLRAAVELASAGRVLVVSKEALSESNTAYAQGGIAVAMGGEQDVALHLEDTLAAGDGLVNRAAAAVLVAEGPERVEELLAWGTRFDRQAGELMLTREGAHSRPRILHANGDATGAEMARSLLARARSLPNIRFAEWTMLTELIGDESGRIAGAGLVDPAGRLRTVAARAVLLASGGAGQLYSDTTNPAVATGDGIAAAARAGAELEDMEFYQFHPTALSLPGVPRFLMSEALRGEGAWLRNDRGERFLERYHPLLELASRDVVARAVAEEGMAADGSPRPVYLDMRHLRHVDVAGRFPGISRFLAAHGLRLDRDLIPVRPAAHYLMGGVRTDLDGRTSLAGLYAAGEIACTGVHGANRLASNSLLEGLVFGARAARAMGQESGPARPPAGMSGAGRFSVVRSGAGRAGRPAQPDEASAAIEALQAAMWRGAGLLRDRDSLAEAGRAAERAGSVFADLEESCRAAGQQPGQRLRELGSLALVAGALVRSAQARRESRGAHYRRDFPRRDDRSFGYHSLLRPGAPEVEFPAAEERA